MATNYTFGQAVKVIAEGTDKEAMIDIGRRFPLLMNKVTKLVALAGNDFVEFASIMPEYLTAGKVNKSFANDENTDDVVENTEEVKEEKKEEKPARRRRKKAEEVEEEKEETEEVENDKYAGMTAMDLFKECKKRKIKVEPKKTAKFYADVLKKDDAKQAAANSEEEDDWGDEEEEVKPAKKAPKKAAPKKEEPKDDDDEDWDI